MKHSGKLVYPRNLFHLILRSSENDDEYWGLHINERKQFEDIQYHYNCRHCLHQLPDEVQLKLHRFDYDEEKKEFTIDMIDPEPVQLNTLEEDIVEYFAEDME